MTNPVLDLIMKGYGQWFKWHIIALDGCLGIGPIIYTQKMSCDDRFYSMAINSQSEVILYEDRVPPLVPWVRPQAVV